MKKRQSPGEPVGAVRGGVVRDSEPRHVSVEQPDPAGQEDAEGGREEDQFADLKRALRNKRLRVAVISAKNHKCQRRKRQSVTAKREKSQTPKQY